MSKIKDFLNGIIPEDYFEKRKQQKLQAHQAYLEREAKRNVIFSDESTEQGTSIIVSVDGVKVLDVVSDGTSLVEGQVSVSEAGSALTRLRLNYIEAHRYDRS